MTDDEIREITEKLCCELVACQNVETEHAYKPGNEQCDEHTHIEQALRSVAKKVREETLEEAAAYFVQHQCSSDDCLCSGTVQIRSLKKEPEKGESK